MFKIKPVTANPNGGNFTGSMKYTTAFTLTSDTTVKAIAVKAGMTKGDVASFTFTKSGGVSTA